METVVLDWIFGIALLILGGAVGFLGNHIRATDERERDLGQRISELETKVTASFVAKEDMNRKGDQLRRELANINARIDALKR